MVVKCLGVLGVDAYRGSTQLTVILPDKPEDSQEDSSADGRFPHNAKYFSEHVVYLPVNKFVPFHVLDHMADVCGIVSHSLEKSEKGPLKKCKSILKSKL